MAIVLIGIDDTRNAAAPGTGKFSRGVCAEIVKRGGRSLGITRHQLFRDERISCKRHNRSVCLSIDWSGDLADLDSTIEKMRESAAQEARPAACIVLADAVPIEVIAFGEKATREVLSTSAAIALAKSAGIALRSLGRTELPSRGMIGALASVGLRAAGNNGWFHDLPGVRALNGLISRAELESLGVIVEHQMLADASIPPIDQPAYRTLDWVRPRLRNGIAVWTVEWDKEHHEWLPADRRGCWSME
jgi:hypothetical protein